MSLLAVSVFLSESILTSIDGHFELFFGFLKNNYTYLESSEDMYGEVLDLILKSMQSQFGVFAYLDEEGAAVSPSMTKGVWEQCRIPDKSIRFPRETWGDNIWVRAILQKKSLLKNDPGRVPEGHLPIKNVLVVPILFRDEVIGHFEVANKEGGYTQADAAWMEGIAQFIAPVLNARLEQERQEKARTKAEEALKKSEEKYHSLIENASDAIIAVDKKVSSSSLTKRQRRCLAMPVKRRWGVISLSSHLPVRERARKVCWRSSGIPKSCI